MPRTRVITYDDVELPPNRLATSCAPNSTVTSAAKHGWRRLVGARATLAGGSEDRAKHREYSTMKVVLFCGGLGMRMREMPRTCPSHGAYRLPAHPVARDEVLRSLRPQGFHLCLGYKARRHQELLPQLQRMRLERLRPVRRAARTSNCSTAISTTGASPSSIPASTPTSACV